MWENLEKSDKTRALGDKTGCKIFHGYNTFRITVIMYGIIDDEVNQSRKSGAWRALAVQAGTSA